MKCFPVNFIYILCSEIIQHESFNIPIILTYELILRHLQAYTLLSLTLF